MREKLKNSKPARVILASAFWLAVWQLAAYRTARELLLPAPMAVFRTLLSLGATPEFWLAAGVSLLRIFGGFLSGVVLGGALGIITSFSALADTLISPLLRAVRATPVASFIILALLWINRALVPVFIAMLMVVPVVWGNVRAGIAATDAELLEMARAYRFGGAKTLRLVYLPSVKPYFHSGCMTSLGMAWKSGVAAEVLCLPKQSIGAQLYYSKIYLETPALFAWTAVVILLSFLLERLLAAAFRVKARGGGPR